MVTILPIGSGYIRAKPFPVLITQHFSNLVILHPPAYEDGTECFETPGNYPEAYNIQNTAKEIKNVHIYLPHFTQIRE